MGKQICADDELFSEAPSGTGVSESVDLALFGEDADGAEVDVPIDIAGSNATMEAGADPGLDVDFAGSSAADDVDDLDLDLGADFSPDADSEVDLSLSPDSPTMESPTMDGPIPKSLATATRTIKSIEDAMPESPGADSGDAGGVGLDDLGVNVDDAAGDDQTAGTGAVVDDDAETMIATDAVASGLTIGDEDATMLSSDAELSAMEAPFKPKEVDATADWPVLDEAALSDIGVEDLAAALGPGDETVEDFQGAGGATVEQPQPDHGASAVELEELSETDTMKAPGLDDLPEEPTMTEVGTKLDLARAYIDMGDPDGARSILKEVLEEGDDSQQQEARQLLDELKD
jgi:pilus assembly protein FimV